ncbi:ATP-binding protein [Streptacidiphilus sp. PAMC 29251]
MDDDADRHRPSAHALEGRPDTTGQALDLTRTFLRGHVPGLDPRTAQDTLLVVAELVTNAVRHAPGPHTLTLTGDSSGTVEIAVSDRHTSAPVAHPPELLGIEGGHGWHLVNQLADHVEIRWEPGHGKTITVRLHHHA